MPAIRDLVVRNLGIQTVTEGVAMLCGLAGTVIVSRHLDVAGFGAFNYAFAFMFLFLSLNDLGISSIVVRDIAQAPERAAEIIGSAMTLRLTIAAAVFALTLASIWLWPMDPALRAPLSLFALVLPLNALTVPGLLFQTAMRFDLIAVVTIVWRVGGLLLLAAGAVLGFGLTGLLGALLVADVIGIATTFVLARRLARFRPHVDRPQWARLLRSAAPIAVSLILVAVLNRVDFIMLEKMTSLEDVGLYGAAYRVTNMLEKFPILVMGTLYPVMSMLAVSDTARLRHVYRRALSRFGLVAVPLALVIGAIAPWLLATAFGETYRASAPALRYLVWSTAFLYVAMIGGYLLNSVRRSRDNVLALAAGAVLNIGLNAILIPSRGIEGAAMATAAGYALVLVITLVAVERNFSREQALSNA